MIDREVRLISISETDGRTMLAFSDGRTLTSEDDRLYKDADGPWLSWDSLLGLFDLSDDDSDKPPGLKA